MADKISGIFMKLAN